MNSVRVVASLTTMPDRYAKLAKTLLTINNQTRKLDAIYLGLPYRSKRLDIDYPELPAEISSLCTVVRCPDYGPITKIVGGILSERSPNTVIITFDDDMIYPNTIVEKLLEQHIKDPNCALGSSGMLLKYSCPMCAITPNENNIWYRIPKFGVPSSGRKVDSIYGYPGALYVRKFFPDAKNLEEKFIKYALTDHNTFMNDDIMISGYLSMLKIERKIFPNMPNVDFVTENGIRVRNDNEISYNLDLFFKRLNDSVRAARDLGMYDVTEEMYMSETIAGVCAILVVSVIILILAIIWAYNSPLFAVNN